MKPQTSTVAVGALVAALALGGVGIATADSSGQASAKKGTTNATSAQDSAKDGEDGAQEQNPSYTGSVKAPQDSDSAEEASEGKETDGKETDGKETDGSEKQESKALQSLATITPSEAEAAALAAVPGTAGQVELENENGYVVYGVEVTGNNGKTIDVKVDAGNGTVLAQDSDDDSESDEG